MDRPHVGAHISNRPGSQIYGCRVIQLPQDRAGLPWASRLAARAQVPEFRFQCTPFLNACRHMPDMLVEYLVHLAAVCSLAVHEARQRSDLVQSHVQAAAAPNEHKSLDMTIVVDAVVACAARGRRDQSLAFVEAICLWRGAAPPLLKPASVSLIRSTIPAFRLRTGTDSWICVSALSHKDSKPFLCQGMGRASSVSLLALCQVNRTST